MYKSISEILIAIILIFFLVSCSSSLRYESDKDEKVSDTKTLNRTEIGNASYYSTKFNGRTTSNGEKYNMHSLTAAHPTYPFNTILRVVNLSNNKSVVVRVNDRMPNFKGRIIDLSLAAAKKLDMVNAGVQKVRVDVIKWGDK